MAPIIIFAALVVVLVAAVKCNSHDMERDECPVVAKPLSPEFVQAELSRTMFESSLGAVFLCGGLIVGVAGYIFRYDIALRLVGKVHPEILNAEIMYAVPGALLCLVGAVQLGLARDKQAALRERAGKDQ